MMRDKEFAALVQQYEKLVFTICYQLVRDWQEAENLAQDTFLSAYTHLDSCRDGNYRPWLARIASNKAKDYLKSAYMRKVTVQQEGMDSALPLERSPEEVYAAKADYLWLREQVLALSEPYRQAAILYFLQEQNVEQIAKVLGRPKKTIQTQLYRAKILLRQMIKEDGG